MVPSGKRGSEAAGTAWGARLRKYRGGEPSEQRVGDTRVTLVNKII